MTTKCPKCGSEFVSVRESLEHCYCYDCKTVFTEWQQSRIAELVEGIRTISQIRRTNLWNTCIDCDNDRCDHGASRDLIMQQVANLLREPK
jgi:hypothetical protein